MQKGFILAQKLQKVKLLSHFGRQISLSLSACPYHVTSIQRNKQRKFPCLVGVLWCEIYSLLP